MRRTFTIGLLLLAAILGTQGSASAEILGLGGKCLDLKGGRIGNGVDVVLNTCKDNETQQWTAADGRIVGPENMCLDAADDGRSGSPAVISTCSGRPAQQWTPARGRITHADGTCLEARGTAEQEEVPVLINPCGDVDGQRWTLQESP